MKKLPTFKKKSIKKPNLNYKKLARSMIIVGTILFVASAYVAYTRLYLTNERRFWIAIENSMSTASVTREVQNGGTGNKTIDKSRFTFGAQAVTNKISSISQKSATSESNVSTETMQTPTSEYVRYLNISTNEKRQDGGSYDFNKALGLWAVQSEANTPDEKAEAKLSYVQPHITLAPFGNMRPNDRNEIMNKLKNDGAYEVDYKNARVDTSEGSKYLLFNVRVKTKKYVKVLQDQFTMLGYGIFPPLNAANYPENARVNGTFVVDAKSNTLIGIVFNNVTERYSNYGFNRFIELPTNAVPLDDLQQRLQEAQS